MEVFLVGEMSKKLTHEQFMEKFNEISLDEYECLTTYNGTSNPITVRHLSSDCNFHKFSTTPNRFINTGNKCPMCYSRNKLKLTSETFQIKLQEQMGTAYTVESEYIGALCFIYIRHTTETGSHVFRTTPQRVCTMKQGCPICSPRLNADNFVSRVKQRYGQEYKLLSEYKGASKDITFRHESPDCNYSISTRKVSEFMHSTKPRTCRACAKRRQLDYIKNIKQTNSLLFKSH